MASPLPASTFGIHPYKLPTPSKEFMETLKELRKNGEFSRYPSYHTPERIMCRDLLREGFHKSFSELFNLLRQQEKECAQLDLNTGCSALVPLLEDEPEKLNMIEFHLTTAEAAQRKGKMDIVYNSRLSLAQYFEQTGDTWLADHFYDSCLKTSLEIKDDKRRTESEANRNIGMALEKKGDLYKAAEHFETFYNLTKGNLWETTRGENLHSMSCEKLRQVYTAIANKLKKDNMTDAIGYLLKAYDMSKESGDMRRETLTCYRIGKAYEETNNAETAILYYKTSLEKCLTMHDEAGMARVFKDLQRASNKCKDDTCDERSKVSEVYYNVALALEEKGDFYKAIEYFESFYDLTKGRLWQTNDGENLHTMSCENLGRVYTAIADMLKEDKMTTNMMDVIGYLLKAYKMNVESGDMHQEGLACYRLANAYEETSDTETAVQYYQKFLTTEFQKSEPEREMESVANCSVGLAYEKEGDLYKASEHFDSCYKLTKETLWETKNGNMHSMSCENLRRVYTAIADMLKNDNMPGAIDYLLKAYEMAKESGDMNQEGLASYRIGNAYEETSDAETAIQYYSPLAAIGMEKAAKGLTRASKILVEQKKEITMENNRLVEQKKEITMENNRLVEQKKEITTENNRLVEQNKKITTENSRLVRYKNNLRTEGKRLVLQKRALRSENERLEEQLKEKRYARKDSSTQTPKAKADKIMMDSSTQTTITETTPATSIWSKAGKIMMVCADIYFKYF